MKLLLSTIFAMLLFANPTYAVSFWVVDSNSDYIELTEGGTTFRIYLDTLRQGSDALRAADLIERVQTFTQVRMNKAGIVDLDEPTRMVDPGGYEGGGFGERFFWCDEDGTPTPGDQEATTHVCAQGSLVSDAFWDEDGQMFVLTIRNARDCSQDATFVSCQ